MNQEVTQLVGYEFPPFRFTVERGKIREFVRAIGDRNPIYVDPEAAKAAGFRDVTIPPTFPTVIDMWGGGDFFQLMAALDLNPAKVLHGEQEYEYLAEVYPGDEITARMKVVKAAKKTGNSGDMKILTVETVYVNRRGDAVLIARSRIIERQ